jgi:hypothetical protein
VFIRSLQAADPSARFPMNMQANQFPITIELITRMNGDIRRWSWDSLPFTFAYGSRME